LAQTYYQKGDYATAIYGFEKLDRNVEEFPEKQQLSYDLGYAYFKSKNFKKPKSILKNILKIRNLNLKTMQNCVWQIRITLVIE
jgi:outer membrane protein assembly factor BamD (BamD/ComL family)